MKSETISPSYEAFIVKPYLVPRRLNMSGQNAEYFEFSAPTGMSDYSIFDSVEFADNRLVQDYIGTTRRKSDKRRVPFWLLGLLFPATAYENIRVEEISLAYLFFSVPGALTTAIPRKALYEFRLNHLNGKYILLRRAPDR